MRIEIVKGRPKGTVEAKCKICGYFAYVDGEELKMHKGGGQYSNANAWVDCGNPDCTAHIPIPLATLPKDVTVKEE